MISSWSLGIISSGSGEGRPPLIKYSSAEDGRRICAFSAREKIFVRLAALWDPGLAEGVIRCVFRCEGFVTPPHENMLLLKPAVSAMVGVFMVSSSSSLSTVACAGGLPVLLRTFPVEGEIYSPDGDKGLPRVFVRLDVATLVRAPSRDQVPLSAERDDVLFEVIGADDEDCCCAFSRGLTMGAEPP